MKRVLALIRQVTLGVGLAVSAAACDDGSSTLRVGITAFPTYEYLYLAKEQGFFDREGLDVRIIEFASLTDIRRAYERGQIDIMPSTLVEALAIRGQSTRSPQVVRAIDYSNGADVVMAQPWIKSAANLRGARVGVELAAVPHYVLARGLVEHGLDLKDVRLISLDQAAMDAAFRRGDIEAVVSYPPMSHRLRRELQVNTVFTSAAIPREIFDVILVDAAVTRTRAREVRALLRAFDAAVAFTRSAPDRAIAVMAERQGLAPEDFAPSLADGVLSLFAEDQMRTLRPGGPLDRATARTNEFLRATGQLTGPDRSADLVNRHFSEAW